MIQTDENTSTPLVGDGGRARWLMLVLYSLIAASNAFMFVWLASVSNLGVRHYNTSMRKIHGTAQAVYLGYILAVPFAMAQFQRLGLRWTIIIAGILNAAGAVLRVVDDLNFIIAGSFLVGVAISFFIGAPTWLSSSWFNDDERTTATSIAVLATQAGLALGFIIPPIFIHKENQTSMIPSLHYATAVVCIVIAILTAVLFRSEPRSLPPGPGIVQAVAQAASNCQLMWVTIIFGIVTGIYWTLLLVLCSIFQDSYTNKEIGYLGSLYCCGGLASMVATGIFFDQQASNPPYRAFIGISLMVSTVFLGVFTWVVQEKDSLMLAGFACTAIGVALPMVQPALLELAVEYSAPELSEEVSGTLLFLAAMAFGFFLPFLVEPPSIGAIVALTVAVGLCGLLVPLLSPDYKRTQQRQSNDSNVPRAGKEA